MSPVLTPHRGALAMALRHCFVFPLWWPIETPDGIRHCACPNGERCPSPAKHPINFGWQNEATTDPKLIAAWFAKWPGMNYGIFLGPSGILVLDADERPQHSGMDTIRRLEDLIGALPRTWVVATGGGGFQFYFKLPAAFDWRTEKLVGNLAGIGLGPGVDVQYGGKLVVGPGSWHVSGKQYVFLGGEDGVVPWEEP
jgi:hypothetical protein